MCGIAGILRFDGAPVDCADIKRMTDALAHRGPDGEGQWCEGPVGLGHRRLAIIDLSVEADQPMHSLDGRYVITYNGEVYNFRELRRELEKSGSRFRSQSDTEVVLEAVVRWGIDSAIKRFNGMFAFAIWDRATASLVLARDRYGIKPLYYRSSPSFFSFASEYRALSLLEKTVPPIDPDSIAEYLTFQNLFGDRTMAEGTRLVPPGHVLTVDLGHLHPRIALRQFWDFPMSVDQDQSIDRDYALETGRLLESSVRRQLVSDVEVGSYLSGGVDSGAIATLASRYRVAPRLKTFTIGFDGTDENELGLQFDERLAAEAMSSYCGSEHFELVLHPSDIEESLRPIAWHLEDPRVGQSYPNYFAARLASHFVKVVMSGVGGDEMFGGYPWRYFSRTEKVSREVFIDSYFRRWQRLMSEGELQSLMRPLHGQYDPDGPRRAFEGVFGDRLPKWLTTHEQVQASLYFESKTFLHGLLLVEDRLSMAFGIETRLPFLDNDLVDFAVQLPTGSRVPADAMHLNVDENYPGDKKALVRSTTGKMVLRNALSRYIPRELAQAPKRGFSGPDEVWFRGGNRSFVERRLMGSKVLFEYLDQPSVARVLEEHQGGRANRRLLIWSLLALEELLSNAQS